MLQYKNHHKRRTNTFNSLSSFESSIKNLKIILESESKKAISWLQSNKMIVNPGKFQGIIIDEKN